MHSSHYGMSMRGEISSSVTSLSELASIHSDLIQIVALHLELQQSQKFQLVILLPENDCVRTIRSSQNGWAAIDELTIPYNCMN